MAAEDTWEEEVDYAEALGRTLDLALDLGSRAQLHRNHLNQNQRKGDDNNDGGASFGNLRSQRRTGWLDRIEVCDAQSGRPSWQCAVG